MCNLTQKIKKEYIKKNTKPNSENKNLKEIFTSARFNRFYDENVGLFSIENYVCSYQKEDYTWD